MSREFGYLGLPIIGINSFGYSDSYASRTFAQYHNAVETTGLGQGLLKRLNDDPRVNKMLGQLIPCGLNNSAGFDVKILTAWWLKRSNEVGQAQADAELEDYFGSDEVDVIVSHWVVGLNPSKVMALGNGYDLYPLADMPDSDSKERYSQAVNKFNRLDGPVPRAAICKTVKRKKIKVENSDEISVLSNTILSQIDNLILILNCIPGVICLPWIQTSHLPENVPTGIISTSDLRWPMNDFSYQKIVNVIDLDEPLVANLLTGFAKLDENSTQRISMAMYRLAIAKATNNIQSAALDLGISLEMVLLAGEGGKSQIRHKFSTRASWLIGRDGQERLILFKLFQRIYDDRSSIAHEGFSNKLQKCNFQSSGKHLTDNFALAERVFREIIINGLPTCWNALVLDALNQVSFDNTKPIT